MTWCDKKIVPLIYRKVCGFFLERLEPSWSFNVIISLSKLLVDLTEIFSAFWETLSMSSPFLKGHESFRSTYNVFEANQIWWVLEIERLYIY